MEIKCDHCYTYTSSFVVTAEYKKFCRLQTPGFLPDKDCMTDYLQDPKSRTPTIPLPNTVYKSNFYS